MIDSLYISILFEPNFNQHSIKSILHPLICICILDREIIKREEISYYLKLYIWIIIDYKLVNI